MNKLILKSGVVLSLSLVSASAFAEFSVNELHSATALALEAFTAANPGHSDHVYGYKTWKSTDDAKVKIYVTHNGGNMEFNFLCHKHNSKIECHAQ